jgi:DNA helicase HerA-like ATPase
VDLLANSIPEMRTYGEGFIIADQSPGLLDISVIRNTNTKIILRLPEQSDRELVGLAASLDKEQVEELSKLERGVVAIYQNDWVEPVLVKVNKCGIAEQQYIITSESGILDTRRYGNS